MQPSKLIEAFKALKFVQFRPYVFFEWCFSGDLLKHAETLETLSIPLPGMYTEHNRYENPGHFVGCTALLHRLKYLHIPYQMLTGRYSTRYAPQDISPLLPQSLQCLVIVLLEVHAVPKDHPCRLEDFVRPISYGVWNAVDKGSLPHLRTVELRLFQCGRILLPDFDIGEARTALKRRHIDLDVSIECEDLKNNFQAMSVNIHGGISGRFSQLGNFTPCHNLIYN